MSMRARWGSVLLLLLGLSRMAATLAGNPDVAALTEATGAAPAPASFSSAQGLEVFSSQVSLTWMHEWGSPIAMDLTADRFARIRGPDQRRSVYAALAASGPLMVTKAQTRPMFWALASSALCGERPLLDELGAAAEHVVDPVVIHLQPTQPAQTELSMDLTVPCE